MEYLKPIERSVIALYDKVMGTDYRYLDERDNFIGKVRECKTHEQVYAWGEKLDEYLQHEFFDRPEWAWARKAAVRWLKTWKDKRFDILGIEW